MFKGKKMAGQMGDKRVTKQNLEVFATDPERGLILVKGSVPGAKGGYLLVSDAIKRPLPEGVPFPASLRNGVSEVEAAPAEAEPAAEPTEGAPASDAGENEE